MARGSGGKEEEWDGAVSMEVHGQGPRRWKSDAGQRT